MTEERSVAEINRIRRAGMRQAGIIVTTVTALQEDVAAVQAYALLSLAERLIEIANRDIESVIMISDVVGSTPNYRGAVTLTEIGVWKRNNEAVALKNADMVDEIIKLIMDKEVLIRDLNNNAANLESQGMNVGLYEESMRKMTLAYAYSAKATALYRMLMHRIMLVRKVLE